MKRALTLTAFLISLLALTGVLLVPVYSVGTLLFPSRPGPDGLYRGTDAPWMPVAGCVCLWVSNKIVSIVFQKLKISPTRWSLFSRRS